MCFRWKRFDPALHTASPDGAAMLGTGPARKTNGTHYGTGADWHVGVVVSITMSRGGAVGRYGRRERGSSPARLDPVQVERSSSKCAVSLCAWPLRARSAGPGSRSRLASMSALRRRRSGVLSVGGELAVAHGFLQRRGLRVRSDRASTIRAGHDREVDRCPVRCR